MNIYKKLATYTSLLILLVSFTCVNAEKNQIMIAGTFYGANTHENYIVADDIKFLIDNGTRVYDALGQIRSLKSIKPGQQVDMYYRSHIGQTKKVSDMILDKIVYYAK